METVYVFNNWVLNMSPMVKGHCHDVQKTYTAARQAVIDEKPAY